MSEYKLKESKIEKAVVGAYKKIEKAAVGAYKKVETAFVDAFLEEIKEIDEKKDKEEN